jgi:hypothetical protein
MSPQTETKASVGFKAGVKEYKLTYYTPEYETKDFTMTAILERRESESLWGRFCNWITYGRKKETSYLYTLTYQQTLPPYLNHPSFI